MAAKFDLAELERRMRGAYDQLKKELGGLRTGRASSHLLDPVQVSIYGARMPLTQCATVSTPDAKTISVQVWDKSQVAAVEKGIREANLGLNPIIDGTLIRLPIPALNADRRNELVKLAHKYAEHGRVVVRNVRRDGMDLLKKLEKDGAISQDDGRIKSDLVQKATDGAVGDVDALLAAKEQEIMQV